MNDTSQSFSELISTDHQANSANLGDFARRIAFLTAKMLDDGKVKRPVAIDGMKRLRSDLLSKGASSNDVEPITRLLEVLQQL